MRIFYGVYIEDVELSAAIDLVRWLAEPDYYRRCHVTVRGPYERRLSDADVDRFNKVLHQSGNAMTILEPGSFFFGKQSTAILRCEVVGIRDIWHKPDFQQGEPHITLYDGPTIQTARVVKHIASQYAWNIVTDISDLQVIERKSRVDEYLDLYFEKVWELGGRILGPNFSGRSVALLSWLDRVNAIARICQYITHDHKRKSRSGRRQITGRQAS